MLEFGPDSDDIGEDFVGRLEVLAEKRTLERNAGHLDRPLPFSSDISDLVDGPRPDEPLGESNELVKALESRPCRIESQPRGNLPRVESYGNQINCFHDGII